MDRIKMIRKIGLWVIAGLTLLALLVMNVLQRTGWVDTVVLIAIILMVVWMVAMGIAGSIVSHRKGN